MSLSGKIELVAFVTILNLYLLNTTMFEGRLINSHWIKLSILKIFAGKVEEVTDIFFIVCIPPGKVVI